MNMEIGTEATQFLFWVIYINGIFGILRSALLMELPFAEYEQKNIQKHTFSKLNFIKFKIIAVHSALCANLTQLFCNSEKCP